MPFAHRQVSVQVGCAKCCRASRIVACKVDKEAEIVGIVTESHKWLKKAPKY